MQYQFRKRPAHASLSDRELLLHIFERIEVMADSNATALSEVTAIVEKELSVTNSLRALLGAVKADLDKEIALLSSVVPTDAVMGLRALAARLSTDVDANAVALLANTPAADVPPAQEAPPAPVADPSAGTTPVA